MFLTKIWIVLLAAVGGLMAGISFLAPTALDHNVTRKDEELLRRGYVVADLYLEGYSFARRRRVAEIGRDVPLATKLAGQATARDPQIRTATVNEIKAKLEGFNSKLNAGIAMVVDDTGLVVVRNGAGSGNPPDSVANTGLVRKALSGEDDKDTWVVEGRLFRVVGAPVSAPGGKIVGALVFGFELNDEQAAAIQARAGSEVAFFLEGKRVARSLSLDDGPLAEVPGLLQKSAGVAKSPKPTDPTPISGGKYMAIVKGLGGEAAEQGAVYVLLAPHKRAGSLFDFVRSAPAEYWKGVPWGPVGGAAGAALVLAFIFIAVEAERPLKKLLREARDLAEGSGARFDDRKYSGKYGSLARAINDILRKGHRAPAAEAFMSQNSGNVTKEINLILGGVASPRQFELPNPEPVLAQGTLMEQPAIKAAQAALDGKAAKPARPPADKPKVVADKSAAPAVLEDDAAKAAPIKPAAPKTAPDTKAKAPATPAAATSKAADGPPPKPPRPPAVEAAKNSSGARPMPQPPVDAAPSKNANSGARPMPQPPVSPPGRGFKAQKPPTLVQAAPVADAFDEAPIPQPDVQPVAEREIFHGEATVVAEVPENLLRQSAREDSALDEAVHYREIFEQFVDTKKRCGEPTANLTYEKFVTKLEANREQIVSKYTCKSVRFQVYVKDGKAALKATPVKG
jgi:hypothetical protein